MNLFKIAVIDGLGIVGIGLIAYGAYLYSNPMGFIVFGCGLIVLAYIAGKNS